MDEARTLEKVAEVTGLRVALRRDRGTGHVEVLRGIDLAVRRGEILGVVGESGSGKSVLALTLMGLLPVAAAPQVQGTARVAGTDMVTGTPEQLRAVRRGELGVIFQDPMTSLNPTMRVGRQIAEALPRPAAGTGSATVGEQVENLLAEVGVPQARLRMQVYPHELSGGLRQRVMAVIAAAGRPALIIADEPTTALDVTVQAQLLALLRELRDDFGCGILLITHDLAVAAQITDRIAVMHAGEVVELGPTAQVLTEPAHPRTAELLASRLSLDTPRDVVRAGPADQAEATRAEVVRASGLACTYTVRSRGGRRTAVHALRGVDLTVGAGEAVSIVGESGSGKSTLLRVLAGLTRPTGGTLSVTGEVLMVFQDAGSSLTPWLTVGELLAERLRPLRLGRVAVQERVEAALTSMGLPVSVAGSRPGQLSGGQRQRIALARATMIPPAVLLCDEPTSALDASRAASVLELIRSLRRDLGTAVVFVTHDLAVARLMGDRIGVMRAGELVEFGTTEQVVGAPAHEYTRALLAAVPSLEVPC